MTVVFLTFCFFSLCFAGLGIGLILSDRTLKGSCGGEEPLDVDGNPIGCGACPKKEVAICPSDDPLVQLAQISHPNPQHHRDTV